MSWWQWKWGDTVNVSLNRHCGYKLTGCTQSGVGWMIQCPTIPIFLWYDFQGDDVLLLVEANRLGWVTNNRKISTDQRVLFLCAVLVSDRGHHVSTLVGDINCSRDQISFFKLGGTPAGDARETAGDAPRIKTASGLGFSWYRITNFGEMCKPLQ